MKETTVSNPGIENIGIVMIVETGGGVHLLMVHTTGGLIEETVEMMTMTIEIDMSNHQGEERVEIVLTGEIEPKEGVEMIVVIVETVRREEGMTTTKETELRELDSATRRTHINKMNIMTRPLKNLSMNK